MSEFLYDLQSPGPCFQRMRVPPLVERNPVLIWQAVSLVLLLSALLLLGLRAHGHCPPSGGLNRQLVRRGIEGRRRFDDAAALLLAVVTAY